MPVDTYTILAVAIGVLIAGFTTGFAGFGTGLVASGIWFHVLPAGWVPPMVAITSVAGQLAGIIIVRRAFNWHRVSPYLVGGLIGVPLGVYALSMASPELLRAAVGAFLFAYGVYRLAGPLERIRTVRHSRGADGVIGVGGGFLGGFAGLSGVLPLVWLQLQGGSTDSQRAVYQPFNLVVLTVASVAMISAGQVEESVFTLLLLCLPATLAGAAIGSRAYRKVSEKNFHRAVLVLLLVSGLILVIQAFQ